MTESGEHVSVDAQPKPTPVDEQIGGGGPTIRIMKTLDESEQIAPAVSGQRTAMELAVSEGLASNAQIPGVTVGGKTGTAETGENNEPFNLWFTWYGELDDRSVAVAVVVVPDENIVGDTSNVIAAPIGRAVIEAVLNS